MPSRANRLNYLATGDSYSSASAGGGRRSTAELDRFLLPSAVTGCPISRILCEKWEGGTLACARSRFCFMLALFLLPLHANHAALDRQISAVVRDTRNVYSARASG